MEALKRLTLALTVALVGAACGGDDDGGNTSNLDGGAPRLDGGGSDAAKGDGGLDLSTLPCHAGTLPAGDKCGGSHCLQTEAELKAAAVAGAKCGGDVEIKSFCSLEAVNNVASCTNTAFVSAGLDPETQSSEFSASVKTCAATKEPAGFSGTCLDCFVETARCAAVSCLTECLGDTNADICTACRIDKGCIGAFYTCAGITNPLSALQ